MLQTPIAVAATDDLNIWAVRQNSMLLVAEIQPRDRLRKKAVKVLSYSRISPDRPAMRKKSLSVS